MKHLILLRHGKAVGASATGDHARALSSRGLFEASGAGAALMQQVVPDFALVSDSRRTRETFDRVAERIGRNIPHRIEPRLYGAVPATILALVAELPSEVRSLLVVGHNPGIAELARTLAVAGDRVSRDALEERFPTSAFAVIALKGAAWTAAARGGALESFVTVDSFRAPN